MVPQERKLSWYLLKTELNPPYLRREGGVVGVSDHPRPGDGGVGRGPYAGTSTAGETLVVSTSTETDPVHF